MSSISQKRLILSVIISFIALAINGLWKIKADNNIFNLASFSLNAAQIFIFLTLSFFGYHILGDLKNPNKRLLTVTSAVVFVALWLYFLFDYILPPSYDFYSVTGRVLSDKYGINWFWMDWGVWVQCITVYLFGLYLYLINLLMNFFQKTDTQKNLRKIPKKSV